MIQTPRKSLPPQVPPGTDPRRFSVPSMASTPNTGTPRTSLGAGDTSGVYSTPGRERPHIRTEDRVDITQYLEQIQRGNKISDTDAWNNKLIEYFDIATFTHKGHINYTQAAKALGGSTTLYKRRVEHLKNETNKVASGMGTDSHLEDDEERVEGQSQDSNADLEIQSVRTRKRNKPDSKPILLAPKKLKLNDVNLTSTTDPLFRKTQVEYDKGDYKSLLLSTLSPDVGGKLSFEDISLKSQVQAEPAPSSILEGNYIEVEIEDYFDILDKNFTTLKVVPHMGELEQAVKAEVTIAPAGDDSVAPGENSTVIMDGAEYENNDMDMDIGSMQEILPIDLNIEHLDAIAPPDGAMAATDVMLLLKHVDDLRNPAKQIQNLRLRQLNDKSAAPKSKKDKKNAGGIDLTKDLRTLQAKVFAKADPIKLQLDSSQLHPHNHLLESIDLRDFTRLNLRPQSTAPATARAIRDITRGMFPDSRPRSQEVRPSSAGAEDLDMIDEAVDNADGPVLQDMLENALQQHDDDAPSDHYSPALLSDLSDYAMDEPNDSQAEPLEPRTRSGNPMRILQRNVDVQQLKENIWHKIENVEQDMPMIDIIRKTNRNYKEREKVDLVPPLYFLNLLHLANEKGIGLESREDFSDVIVHPATSA